MLAAVSLCWVGWFSPSCLVRCITMDGSVVSLVLIGMGHHNPPLINIYPTISATISLDSLPNMNMTPNRPYQILGQDHQTLSWAYQTLSQDYQTLSQDHQTLSCAYQTLSCAIQTLSCANQTLCCANQNT